MKTYLVTGAAGFIGANFVLDWLRVSDEPVLNLDKLTYAGNCESLAELAGGTSRLRILSNLADRRLARAWVRVTPEALTSPGFQMSFAATVALILVQGPWLRISPHLPWWLRPLAMLFLSSLVASMATSPIAAAHFGRITQYGLLANLLVVPVVGLLVMPGQALRAMPRVFGSSTQATAST